MPIPIAAHSLTETDDPDEKIVVAGGQPLYIVPRGWSMQAEEVSRHKAIQA
jgi:hypothetical protein